MSLLLALTGGTSPADSAGAWFDVEDGDDEDDGSWLASLIADAFVPEIVAFQVGEDDEAEDESEQAQQVTPGLNDFIQAAADLQDDDEDEFGEQATSGGAPPLNDFVASYLEAEDAEDDEDLWQPWYLDTPAAVQGDIVTSFFDVDEDELEEAEAVFAQITDSVAAATDFIQALFEVDEDLMFVFRDGRNVVDFEVQASADHLMAFLSDVGSKLVNLRPLPSLVQ